MHFHLNWWASAYQDNPLRCLWYSVHQRMMASLVIICARIVDMYLRKDRMHGQNFQITISVRHAELPNSGSRKYPRDLPMVRLKWRRVGFEIITSVFTQRILVCSRVICWVAYVSGSKEVPRMVRDQFRGHWKRTQHEQISTNGDSIMFSYRCLYQHDNKTLMR